MTALKPDAENMRVRTYNGRDLIVGMGEGIAFLSLDWHVPGTGVGPLNIAVFDPKCDVPTVRSLGELFIAWADAWEGEFDDQ